MRKIEALLDEYGESHQNHTNKVVHWICVPVIVWSIMALLWAMPFPAQLAISSWLNWLTITLVLALLYYVMLSPMLSIGMCAFAALSVFLIHLYVMNVSLPIWQFAIVLFVLAWGGQFWGHRIEGRKPSFLKDIQFLLIGPAWLLSFIYRRLGLPI